MDFEAAGDELKPLRGRIFRRAPGGRWPRELSIGGSTMAINSVARFSIKLLVLMAAAGSALAQPTQAPPAVQAPAAAEVPIAELQITVQDLATKELRDPIAPGETIEVAEGDRVRLRMVAIPAQRNRAPRYPACLFETMAGVDRIRLVNVKADQGSATIEVYPPRREGSPRTITLSYTISESLGMPPAMLQGTIRVHVKEPEPEPEPPAPPPAPVPPPPGAGKGVTLYEHEDFRGRTEKYTEDDRDLHDNYQVGNDKASSLRIDDGCEVSLYEHENYRGRVAVIRQDEPSLAATEVGNDSVTSLRIDCSSDTSRKGVTLYEAPGFRGASEFFSGDDRQLRDNRIGNDRASSVKVDAGCKVTLYEHENFGGRATVLTDRADDLSIERVGDNTVSSLQVSCSPDR
jgi:hypothetical protein